MAKTSFAAQSHPELDAEAPGNTAVLEPEASPSKQTPVVQQSSAVSPLNTSDGDTEGEVNSKDIRLPRLNIVQKSGKLNDDFTPGSIVFDKELNLSDGKGPISLTALKIQKLYQEKLEYDPDGPTPRVFKTADEVRRAGGTTEYEVAQADGTPYFRPMANILVLIEAPTTITTDQKDSYFIYEFEGRAYTVAMWTVTGSGYTGAAKPIFSAKALRLKNGLTLGAWSLTTELKRDARNSWYAPVLKAGGKNSEAFVEFAKGVLG